MAECILMKSSSGVGSDEVTAWKSQVLAGYTALTKDSNDEPVAGTMTDFTKVLNKIQNKRLANGRFEVAVDRGFHNCNWAEGSYEYMELPEVASTIGLTAAKLLKGQTVCGVAGSATSDATATDPYVKNGLTYWKDGVKRTGTMAVSSVVSFSVAAYSTSQVIATWKNPAKGPYSGVVICARSGGYPANSNDGRVYAGVGSNMAINGTSSQIIGGLTAGTTYYFCVWVYCTCSSETLYSGYLQATVKTTTSGRQAFTVSGSFTVPANVRSVNIHCTGGGGGGIYEQAKQGSQSPGDRLGCGGAGGYTAYKNNISVVPGQVITVVVGAGGAGKRAIGGNPGSASSAAIGSTILCSANGAGSPSRNGGSGGGGYQKSSGAYVYDADSNAARGGSNGGNGSGTDAGTGQGGTTREFGLATGTLYAGGGGGCARNKSTTRPAGGDGGGGRGATMNDSYTNPPSAGSAGTGGGGGAGGGKDDYWVGMAGGSGNVIITW